MKTLLMKISPMDAQVSKRNVEFNAHKKIIFFLCSEPPSAPSGVLLSTTNTSITVRWLAPADLGGRTDLYYQVEISDPDNLGSYIGAICVPGSKEIHVFLGLRPCTDYCVRVTAENGVSDQDPSSKDSRTETRCIKTKEGCKDATL